MTRRRCPTGQPGLSWWQACAGHSFAPLGTRSPAHPAELLRVVGQHACPGLPTRLACEGCGVTHPTCPPPRQPRRRRQQPPADWRCLAAEVRAQREEGAAQGQHHPAVGPEVRRGRARLCRNELQPGAPAPGLVDTCVKREGGTLHLSLSLLSLVERLSRGEVSACRHLLTLRLLCLQRPEGGERPPRAAAGHPEPH